MFALNIGTIFCIKE